MDGKYRAGRFGFKWCMTIGSSQVLDDEFDHVIGRRRGSDRCRLCRLSVESHGRKRFGALELERAVNRRKMGK